MHDNEIVYGCKIRNTGSNSRNKPGCATTFYKSWEKRCGSHTFKDFSKTEECFRIPHVVWLLNDDEITGNWDYCQNTTECSGKLLQN